MNRTFASRSALTTLFAVAACLPLRAQAPTGPTVVLSLTNGQTIHQSAGTVALSANASDPAGLRYVLLTGANRTLISTVGGATAASVALSWNVAGYSTGDYTFTYYAGNVKNLLTRGTVTVHLAP